MFKIKFRTVRFLILSYLAVIFQATLVNLFVFQGIKPDIVLLMVVFFGLYNGIRNGLIYGAAMGLCVDALSGGIVGLHAFTLACVGSVCGLLQERVYTRHFLTKLLVSFGAGVFSAVVYYFLAVNFYRLPGISENLGFIFSGLVYTSLFNLFFAEMLERFTVLRTMYLR